MKRTPRDRLVITLSTIAYIFDGLASYFASEPSIPEKSDAQLNAVSGTSTTWNP